MPKFATFLAIKNTMIVMVEKFKSKADLHYFVIVIMYFIGFSDAHQKQVVRIKDRPRIHEHEQCVDRRACHREKLKNIGHLINN